ncbi:methionine--tRNA ligase subunit beta [Candidatus Pacearchaeota archaeon]|nr:methionine--tRNA ligase subunit beta [Candidatus Pacearchaeota archaeon]
MVEDIISFSDWQKLDLRVGKILKVEEIEGADKLWKLEVDLGKTIGKRIICAGIKEFYSKDELKGRKIVVVENLQPRKMRGIESQGMLLAAVSDDESSVVLLDPGQDSEVGWRVS